MPQVPLVRSCTFSWRAPAGCGTYSSDLDAGRALRCQICSENNRTSVDRCMTPSFRTPDTLVESLHLHRIQLLRSCSVVSGWSGPPQNASHSSRRHSRRRRSESADDAGSVPAHQWLAEDLPELMLTCWMSGVLVVTEESHKSSG